MVAHVNAGNAAAATRAFIIGCPRSGTTWAALLLGQHPEIQACQQLGGVPAAETFYLYWAKGEGQLHARFCSSVIRFPNTNGSQAVAPVYEALMSRDEMLAICRRMLDGMYDLAAAKHPGCRVVVNSTPENGRHPELMVELMPDARFLHIIRDPRSVFASHRHGTRDFKARFPTDAMGSAEFWRRDVMTARKLATLSPHYREVRYESLKANGAAEVQGILEWLGVSADPAWCQHVVANTTIDNLKSASGTPKSFFRSGKAQGWQGELTPSELQAVEFYARDLMVDLGYAPVHPRSDHKPAEYAVRELMGRIAARAKREARKFGERRLAERLRA